MKAGGSEMTEARKGPFSVAIERDEDARCSPKALDPDPARDLANRMRQVENETLPDPPRRGTKRPR